MPLTIMIIVGVIITVVTTLLLKRLDRQVNNLKDPQKVTNIQETTRPDVYKTKLNNYGHRVNILDEIQSVLLTSPDGYNYILSVESTESAEELGWELPIHTGMDVRNLPGDAILSISLRQDGNLDPRASDPDAKTCNLSSFVHVKHAGATPELVRFFSTTEDLETRARTNALLNPVIRWSTARVEKAISVVPTTRVL